MTYTYVPPTEPVSRDPRPPSASAVTLAKIMRQGDTNLHGNVHGGAIMFLCDEVAGSVAARHSGGRAVTVSLDELVLLVPVAVGDLVRAHAQVNWTGRSSMEIGVRVETERWDDLAAPTLHVASAYLVFVALDADGRPREIPPVAPQTDGERRRSHEAEIRRDARLSRKQAIRKSRGRP